MAPRPSVPSRALSVDGGEPPHASLGLVRPPLLLTRGASLTVRRPFWTIDAAARPASTVQPYRAAAGAHVSTLTPFKAEPITARFLVIIVSNANSDALFGMLVWSRRWPRFRCIRSQSHSQQILSPRGEEAAISHKRRLEAVPDLSGALRAVSVCRKGSGE